MQNVNLVLLIEGGLIQQVIADVEGEDIMVSVAVADYDIESYGEENLDLVDGDEVHVYMEQVQENSDYVKKVFKAIDNK